MCRLKGWGIQGVSNPDTRKQSQEKGFPVTTLQQSCQRSKDTPSRSEMSLEEEDFLLPERLSAVTAHCPRNVAKVLTGNKMLPIDPFFILVTYCTSTNLRSDIYLQQIRNM